MELNQLAAERVLNSEAEVLTEIRRIALAKPQNKLTNNVKLVALRRRRFPSYVEAKR